MDAVLSRRDAKEMALTIWNDGRRLEMPRLDRIDEAMRTVPLLRPGATAKGAYQSGGWRPKVIIPKDAPDTMWELAKKAPTNYLPLAVEIYGQALRVEGYLSTVEDVGDEPWQWWQANRMDARQVGVHQSALKYGAAYVMPLPGVTADGRNGPSVKAFTPRTMTAIYQDTEMDEWPIAAVYVDGPNGEHLVLVDDEGLHRFALGGPTFSGQGFAAAGAASLDGSRLEYLGPELHRADMGVTPVIRYRDAFLLDGEQQFGIVEPLMVIQERIDETNFEQLVAQFFTAFKQRIVLGWVPSSEAEEMRANAASAIYLDVNPEDVKIQELGGADPGWYSESGKGMRRDFASIAQFPSQNMGVDAIANISDATLSGLNASKNERAGSIALALGESHEQLMRTFAFMIGNMEAARDYNGEVRWAEREQKTWGSQVDGLVKLVQSTVITPATALEMVPGMTDHQVERALDDANRLRAAENLRSMREAATGQGRVGSGVPALGNLPDARE